MSAGRTRRTSSRSDSRCIATARRCSCARARRITTRGPIRFRVPAGQTRFDDLVHGAIAFENEHIENFVILRSDGHPTYHLSVVVDDIDMAISHVVRGDDHISNTPKQILLYEAFGRPAPQFAHVPLIMGPDKKRLSKRHGATSVMEYQRLGYLPEAMVNFLALLGWSPGGDREVLTRDELKSLFTLEGISGGNAVFNIEKLDWFNQQHIGAAARWRTAARIQRRSSTPGSGVDTLAATSPPGRERARVAEAAGEEARSARRRDSPVSRRRRRRDRSGGAAAKHLTGEIRPLLATLAAMCGGRVVSTRRPRSSSPLNR